VKFQTRLLIPILLALAGSAFGDGDERRFRLIPLDEMTPEQRTAADAIMSGPRASVPGSAATASTPGSPFNPWLRSAELADREQGLVRELQALPAIPPYEVWVCYQVEELGPGLRQVVDIIHNIAAEEQLYV
jgi:hypothetical protein